MQKSYNQKYWKKRYYDKEEIKQWFKNYLTYLDGHFHELQNIEEIKQAFLKGEKRELQEIINSTEEQEKIFKFMEEVLKEI